MNKKRQCFKSTSDTELLFSGLARPRSLQWRQRIKCALFKKVIKHFEKNLETESKQQRRHALSLSSHSVEILTGFEIPLFTVKLAVAHLVVLNLRV